MSEHYSFPVSGSNPYQASSSAQPPNSSSPLANASNASFSPSPVTSSHTVPMSAPAGQAVHRGHWAPVIPGAQRTPHQGPTIPAQQDSQLVAQLAKQRAKAGGDQDDDVTEPTKKASLFSRATHKIAKRAGLTTSSLKQPSQIQPQSQHEEPAQSDDNEVDDFVFVSGHASLEPQAASYSPAQQPSYLSYPPQSFYASHDDGPSFEELNARFELLKTQGASSQSTASSYVPPQPAASAYEPSASYNPYAAPAAYPSYSPASYPEPTVVAYGDFSPAQASRSRESRLPLMASRLHYTSAGSTSYGYTTTEYIPKSK